MSLCSPFSTTCFFITPKSPNPSLNPKFPNPSKSLNPKSPNSSKSSHNPKLPNPSLRTKSHAGGNDGNGNGGAGRSDGGDSDESSNKFNPIGAFAKGWKDRVDADPQFPFKVLMEELVGVTACIIGDMISRPNFGLNELDFVLSTLIVGSILNFLLMYILAPSSSSSIQRLPSIFSNCPTSHMFEPGHYSLFNRLGTFAYKGALFGCVGYGAGLIGTAVSNGLIMARKKMDPGFEPPNKPPPTLLNASTWAVQLGISSNLRYQSLNGIEYVLGKWVPPYVFKSSVVVLRCLNNVVGGMSFVALARFTGSQTVGLGADKSQAF